MKFMQMAHYFLELKLTYIFIFSFFVQFSLSQPLNVITSCLVHNHITNFSLFPTSQNQIYSKSNYHNILFFSLQNLRFANPKYPKPSIIILPKSKEQLVSSYICSKKGAYEVKIRSGGHSYEGLSSISNDRKPFVIIDLMNLDKVLVDLKSKTAWVESGATVGQVYYTIAKQSKGEYGFSAGSCPTVGFGGHLSGGGFGLLSRKYGLGADNVVDVLMVDPKGQLLDRATMGEDVYWAVRGGGGGSFGIIYAWKIKLLKVPPRVASFQATRQGTIENISQLVHKWQYVGPYLNDKFYLSVSIGANNGGNGSTSIFATFTGFYLGQIFEAISIISKDFPELRIMENECKETNWIESVLYFSGLDEASTIHDLKNRYLKSKDYFKAKSDYVTIPIHLEGVNGAMYYLAKESKGYIIMDPYGGQMARIANDSIAFPHRKGNLYGIQYLVSWNKEDDTNYNRDQYLDWIREFYDFMEPFVSSNPRAAYVNYLDLDLGGRNSDDDYSYHAVEKGRIWGKKYFLGNYDRLVKAKTIIDPCNVFRHPQGIAPKSSDRVKHCSFF